MKWGIVVFILGSLSLPPALAAAPSNCRIDRANSSLRFTARMIFDIPITGRIERFDGQLRLSEQEPQLSHADITIDTTSINTDNPDTDNFIRSKPMLNSAEFPSATVITKAFDPLSKENLKVSGELTINGIKREMEIPFTYSHRPSADGNNDLVSAEGRFEFSRFAFNIGVDSWSNMTIFKELIEIDIQLEMICPRS
jgi:polyisoprenoid-binding protein YceI